MTDLWNVNTIAQMRILGIKQKELAELCGYSETYLSMVLRGHKDTQKARENIDTTLKKLKQERDIYI